MTKSLTLSFLLLLAVSLSGQEQREITGFNNNTQNPEWGTAGVQLRTAVSNGYADGMNAIAGETRPNARVISNFLFAQDGLINDKLNLSDYVWVFGQFVDHDITLVDNNVLEPLMISVPSDDAIFDPFGTGQVVIPMFRSAYNPATGTDVTNPRKHMNAITAFIDGSAIYGSDDFRASWLRSFKDGKLKTSYGNLLPFNTTTGEFNDPKDPNAPFMADDLGSNSKMFVAGDVRANENLLLLSFQTLFVREHNRTCEELLSEHPAWSDEEIYQKARRMVIAHFQSIVFDEWLPAMGVHLEPYQGYKPDVNPGIFNVFSAAAFRLGHTLLSSNIVRMGANGEEIHQGDISLRDAFFQPLEILKVGGIDPYIKGMGAQIQQDLDCKVIDDVRNFLFGPPGAGGLDLAAINIMRGRERGLPDYNTIREDLGLERVVDFAEICSRPDLNETLSSLYGTVDNIDPWVGMLAEDHMPQALFGVLIMEIMERQFTDLRDGDRFYYEIDEGLTPENIASIKATKFSDLIRRNTEIKLMQENVFFAMKHDNIPFANAVIVPVQLDAVAFPNPAIESLNIKLYSFEEGELSIDIFDLTGKEIQSEMRVVSRGENGITIELGARYVPGLYYANLSIGESTRTIKWVKN